MSTRVAAGALVLVIAACTSPPSSEPQQSREAPPPSAPQLADDAIPSPTATSPPPTSPRAPVATPREDPAHAAPRERPADITAEQFLARATYLASDELEGRESGTPGGRLAEEYFAREFESFGLLPLEHEGLDGTFQVVEMPSRSPLPDRSGLEFLSGDGEADSTREQVIPFSFSHAGTAEGEAVFAGYGLTAPDLEYDDYAGIDVRGKIVLVMRHGPREADQTSPFFLRSRRGARMAAFTTKAQNAVSAGAAALLLVNDPRHKRDGLPTMVPGEPSSIPVAAVSRETAARLLAGTGKTLAEFQEAIDAALAPQSVALDVGRVRVTTALADATARNVVAMRRGTDPTVADEVVLIGAHIDHVGYGWFGSPHGPGEIHNGADDNGSGAAALLEVAEALAAAPPTRRTLVFAGWCAEEKGLVGSKVFAGSGVIANERIVACLNMDMVGRFRGIDVKGEAMRVAGAPTGSGLEPRILALAERHSVELTQSWDAWEQSDHASFYNQNVPSVFFTTGLHPDYHRPGDDVEKLNAKGAASIARVVADLAVELANADGRPTFKEKPPRPILGVRLANAEGERPGALIVQVFANFGAAKAGIKTGDVIVHFAGEAVTSSGDLSRLIRASTPGDAVAATVVRDGVERELTITISGR